MKKGQKFFIREQEFEYNIHGEKLNLWNTRLDWETIKKTNKSEKSEYLSFDASQVDPSFTVAII